MNRSASTLSGGESQRIRLATQIGSQLMGVLYILDEPTIGLHQRDNKRLIKTLQDLRDLGNTIIVVEHDENTIRASDWVIDMGPKAGNHGGKIVAIGTPNNIKVASIIEMSLGASIGAITFTGSIIAFLKLQGLMSGTPITFKGHHFINLLIGIGILGLIVYLTKSQITRTITTISIFPPFF